MIERLLIVLALTALGSGAFVALKQVHLRRLGRVAVADGRPTILYFRSDQCAPCVTQGRYLDKLETEWHGRVAIEKIDTDDEPDKAAQFNVFTLPTTLILDATGQVRQINYGLTDGRKLSMQVASVQVGR
ncbi:MAG: thioredoxin family protein [Anaerolineae bacterium]